MWPFKRRKNAAERVLERMASYLVDYTKPLHDALEQGHLTLPEFRALLRPTAAPYNFANAVFTEKQSPWWNLRFDELCDEESWYPGYTALLYAFFHALRNVMSNDKALSEAVGTSFDELMRKFDALTESDLAAAQRRLDNVVQEQHRDPRGVWYSAAVGFIRSITIRSVPVLEEELFCSTVFSYVATDMGRTLS